MTADSQCPHCGGQRFIESVHGDHGKQGATYVLECLQCSKREGSSDSRNHGYYSRLWFRVRGVPADELELVKRGQNSFVWDACRG